MGDCLELLDINQGNLLRIAFAAYTEQLARIGAPLPVQRADSRAHRLDREVLNYAVDSGIERGRVIHVVRGAFQEGLPVFTGPAIYDASHVPTAVRDGTAMGRIGQVSEPK